MTSISVRQNPIWYRFFIVAISLCFAYFLATLPIDIFLDRVNYINYAQHSSIIATRYDGFAQYVNEPLWLMINIVLNQIFGWKLALQLIIFFSAFSVAYLVLKYDYRYFLVLVAILLLPQVLKNHIVQLRQGLAVAFFLWGYFSSSKKLRYGLFLAAALIHSSFIIVMSIFIMMYFIKRLPFTWRIRLVCTVIVFAIMGLFILTVASLLGARQGDLYIADAAGGSGLGLLFWVAMFGIIWLEGAKFIEKNYNLIGVLAFYIATYFTFPPTARVFEDVTAVLLLSMLGLTGERKYLFYLGFGFYFLAQWYIRIHTPGYGWVLLKYFN